MSCLFSPYFRRGSVKAVSKRHRENCFISSDDEETLALLDDCLKTIPWSSKFDYYSGGGFDTWVRLAIRKGHLDLLKCYSSLPCASFSTNVDPEKARGKFLLSRVRLPQKMTSFAILQYLISQPGVDVTANENALLRMASEKRTQQLGRVHIDHFWR